MADQNIDVWEVLVTHDLEVPEALMRQAATPRILARILAHHPLPRNLLQSLHERGNVFDGETTGSWGFVIAGFKDNIDWSQVLEWRESILGSDRAQEERKDMLRVCHTTVRLDSWNEGLNGLMNALLIHEPALTEQLTSTDTGRLRLCELLSLGKSSWINQADVDQERLVREARMAGMDRALCRTKDGVKALEQWLEQGELKTHWNRLRDNDRRREMLVEAWCQAWMPNDIWKDSPLEQWCQHGVLPEGMSKTPITHELFDTMDARARGHLSPSTIAEMWQNGTGYGARQGLCALSQWAHDKSEISGTDFWPKLTYLDPMAIGLMEHAEDLRKTLATLTGARRLAGLLELDERVKEGLKIWENDLVVAWTLWQPYWQTWRDWQGNSLLDLSVDGRNEKDTSIGWMVRLAHGCPELLHKRNDQGVSLFDRMTMTSEARSATSQILLSAMAQAQQNAESAKPRF